MSFLNRVKTRLQDFWRADSGIISTEVIIMTPLLVWVFLSLFVWWDAFRVKNTAVKATVAIADMISRESAPISNGYIDGMSRIYRYATAAREASWLRVTLLQYDEVSDSYRRIWSRSTNSVEAPVHTHDSVAEMRHALPQIVDADTLMLVETWQIWTPSFTVGLPEQLFYEVTTEKMRSQALLQIG